MPNPLDKVLELQIQRTMNALEANNMEAHYVARADQVKDFVAQMIPEGATVANGGSATLAETGVLDLLSNGKYNFLDRRTVTGEALDKMFHDSFNADWYLASSNAVTEKGELFNVDGNSNRVAAITFGPKNVLLIVGCNKIVPDLAAAQARVKTIAAPANTIRLNCKTPCAVTGQCADCHSPARVCCTTTIHQFQRVKGRIKVLLVGEPLGF